MKNVLMIFIISLMVLSVTVPLDTIYAQVIIEDLDDDPFNDSDIEITRITLVLVLSLWGLVIVLVIVIIIIRKRLARLEPGKND